jgi:hypothetical protein
MSEPIFIPFALHNVYLCPNFGPIVLPGRDTGQKRRFTIRPIASIGCSRMDTSRRNGRITSGKSTLIPW